MNDMLMKQYMDASKVTFLPATKLVKVEGDLFTCKVTVENGEKQSVLECDTVLLALGFMPTAKKAEEFEAVAPVTLIGDGLRPRKIIFAIEDAHEAIRKL